MWKKLFRRWHVEFGVISTTEDGGDYVSRETTTISKSDKNRYGVVFWNKGIGEFVGSVINYLPSQPNSIHPAYSGGGETTPRGYKLQRAPEVHYEGAVRIINVEESDPLGKYELDIVANGKTIKTIKYTIAE